MWLASRSHSRGSLFGLYLPMGQWQLQGNPVISAHTAAPQLARILRSSDQVQGSAAVVGARPAVPLLVIPVHDHINSFIDSPLTTPKGAIPNDSAPVLARV